MENDAGRMSNNIASPGRARSNLVHTLRPTTAKQLLEATTKAGSDTFSIGDGAAEVDLGQVTLVASVLQFKDGQAGTDYTLDDGTGIISGRFWQDKGSEQIQAGAWVTVYGSLRSMGTLKTVNISAIRPVVDHNEITLHFLRVLELNMPSSMNQKGFGGGSSASSASVISGFDQLTGIQKAVLNVYASNQAPQGVHRGSVARSLADIYSAQDVQSAIVMLMSDGYIFETHDADHARIINAG